MLDTVKINHVQHISFTQSRLTDAVSVILSELLSYEHPSKSAGDIFCFLLVQIFNACFLVQAVKSKNDALFVRASRLFYWGITSEQRLTFAAFWRIFFVSDLRLFLFVQIVKSYCRLFYSSKSSYSTFSTRRRRESILKDGSL